MSSGVDHPGRKAVWERVVVSLASSRLLNQATASVQQCYEDRKSVERRHCSHAIERCFVRCMPSSSLYSQTLHAGELEVQGNFNMVIIISHILKCSNIQKLILLSLSVPSQWWESGNFNIRIIILHVQILEVNTRS